MKVARTVPKPPPEFTLTFDANEGWAVVMAFRDAYEKYTQAADRDDWKRWAEELDKELRRDA